MTTPTRRRASSAHDHTPPNHGLWLTIIILAAYGIAISVALCCRQLELTLSSTIQFALGMFFASAGLGIALRKYVTDHHHHDHD